jgi:hypothetical protein
VVAALLICSGLSSSALCAETMSRQKQTGAFMKWEQAELNAIVNADDLQISVFRDDGVNYGTRTCVWCVDQRAFASRDFRLLPNGSSQ